jgi:UDP-3-O-[3-hydroxymyristoyl] glucosamine N-acyltransferase
MKFSELLKQLEKLSDRPFDQFSLADDPELTTIAPIAQAQGGQLTYLEGDKFADCLESTQAAVILPNRPELIHQARTQGLAWVAVQDPKMLFAVAVRLFYQPFKPKPGIHPSAWIDPTVQLGQEVSIGPHVAIYEGVTIGDRVCLMANVVIYGGASIGADSWLHANCTIHERSIIGQHCIIHSGAVIGDEGFGFVPTAQGWQKLDQTGRVVLEDGVDVGVNSTIDRPAMGETRIGRGTKLDNMVHIGHGCQLGEGCAIAAQTGLAGGVELGKGVILAGQVGVANNVKMGDRAIASSKSGLHSDVPAGETVSGYPAIANSQWLKTSAIYRRLPEMQKLLRQIQSHLGLKD